MGCKWDIKEKVNRRPFTTGLFARQDSVLGIVPLLGKDQFYLSHY